MIHIFKRKSVGKSLSLFGVFFILFLASFSLFINTSSKVSALSSSQAAVAHCKKDFFGLEPWYQYMGAELDPSGSCEVKCFNVLEQPNGNDCGKNNTSSDIPLILLAVVDDLLRVAGILAIAFIIYGAFEYVGSQGNSEVTGRAQSMIINALIGLVIAIIAVAAVSYVGNTIGR